MFYYKMQDISKKFTNFYLSFAFIEVSNPMICPIAKKNKQNMKLINQNSIIKKKLNSVATHTSLNKDAVELQVGNKLPSIIPNAKHKT